MQKNIGRRTIKDMNIETLEEAKEFLEKVVEFFKSIDENIAEMNKNLVIKEGEQEDLLHEIELSKLNTFEIAKVATRLKNTRKQRREIKDKLNILKTIKPTADFYYKKGFNAEIVQAITNLNNLEKTWQERKYNPRVLKDLKCVESE